MTQQGSADEEKVPVNSSTRSIHSAAGHSKKFHSIHTIMYYTTEGGGEGHTRRRFKQRVKVFHQSMEINYNHGVGDLKM